MRKIIFFFILAVNNVSAQTIDSYLSAPFPTGLTSSIDGKAIA
jgi:hypothetical protein